MNLIFSIFWNCWINKLSISLPYKLITFNVKSLFINFPAIWNFLNIWKKTAKLKLCVLKFLNWLLSPILAFHIVFKIIITNSPKVWQWGILCHPSLYCNIYEHYFESTHFSRIALIFGYSVTFTLFGSKNWFWFPKFKKFRSSEFRQQEKSKIK